MSISNHAEKTTLIVNVDSQKQNPGDGTVLPTPTRSLIYAALCSPRPSLQSALYDNVFFVECDATMHCLAVIPTAHSARRKC